MIKIIKDGKKPIRYKTIYIITCPKCGCEFECEDSDLNVERRINGKRSINCPCCDEEFVLMSGGFYFNQDNYKTRQEEIKEDELHALLRGWKKDLLTIDSLTTNSTEPLTSWEYDKDNPCDTCPNRFGPRDGLGNPIVGDSPCQWCSHYKYKFTCNILGDANESKN